MKVNRKTTFIIGLAFIGAMVGISSFAWACTVQSRILAISSISGSSRSQVSVRGEAIAPSGLVEVRWNGADGKVLGAGPADERGNFLIDIQIPDSPPGVYSVLAVSSDGALARTAFEVTPSASQVSSEVTVQSTSGQWNQEVAADLWTGFSEGTPEVRSAPQSDSGRRPGLVPGLGLLGIGLLALLATGSASAMRLRHKFEASKK